MTTELSTTQSSTDAVTSRDKTLARQFFIKGGAAFTDAGMSQADRVNWLLRPEIEVLIKAQEQLLRDGDIVMFRQAFASRVQLGDMLPMATEVLRRALKGSLKFGNKDKVQKDEDIPTPEQVEHAKFVMSMCGVDKSIFKTGGSGGLFERDISGDDPASDKRSGRYDIKQTLAREKTGNAVRQIINILQKRTLAVESVEEARRDDTVVKKKKKKQRTDDDD